METREEDCLVRYMRLGRFLEWLLTGSVRLSSPLAWHDQIEAFWFKVIQSELGVAQKKLKSRIFGTCFSNEYYSEALWKRFGNHDDIVRVTIKRGPLVQAASAWCDKHQAVFQMRDVGYDDVATVAEHVRAHISELRKLDPLNVDFGKSLLHFWLRKTRAFEFEDECRLVLYSSKAQGSSVKIPLPARDVVVKVMLDNRMERALRELVKTHLASSIPSAKTGLTVVNRVPAALRRILPPEQQLPLLRGA
jgi:hypothetical protein